MSKEAMKLALEALKQMQAKANFECWNLEICDEAIKALEEVLAVKQEQRNITKDEHDVLMKALAKSGKVVDAGSLAKQEQGEPVAWKLMPKNATYAMLKAMDECSTEGYDERLYVGHASSVYTAAWDALDTTPPQRTWVGLTEPEVDECYESIMFHPDIEPSRMGVYLEIEAKLKEKNNA